MVSKLSIGDANAGKISACESLAFWQAVCFNITINKVSLKDQVVQSGYSDQMGQDHEPINRYQHGHSYTGNHMCTAMYKSHTYVHDYYKVYSIYIIKCHGIINTVISINHQ